MINGKSKRKGKRRDLLSIQDRICSGHLLFVHRYSCGVVRNLLDERISLMKSMGVTVSEEAFEMIDYQHPELEPELEEETV